MIVYTLGDILEIGFISLLVIIAIILFAFVGISDFIQKLKINLRKVRNDN